MKQELKPVLQKKTAMSHTDFALSIARTLSALYMVRMQCKAIIANYRGSILKASPMKSHLNNLEAAARNMETWLKKNLEMKQADRFIEDTKDNATCMEVLFDGLIVCREGEKDALLNELVGLMERYAFKYENQSQNPQK